MGLLDRLSEILKVQITSERIDLLSDMERDVIRLRYGEKCRLSKTAGLLGISKESVKEIEAFALMKLKGAK